MAHGLSGKCSMEPFLRQDPENSSAQLLTAMLRKYSAHLMGMQQARYKLFSLEDTKQKFLISIVVCVGNSETEDPVRPLLFPSIWIYICKFKAYIWGLRIDI